MIASSWSSQGEQASDELKVQVTRELIKLRGVPYQGVDFFRVYYPMFRGRGIILSSTKGGRYGLYSSINSFFTASSVLYLGCESTCTEGTAGIHIEAAVLSPTVVSLEAVCSDPERRCLSQWGSALTRSLATVAKSTSITVPKDASRFRIELPSGTASTLPRDRDLVVNFIDDFFAAAPTPASVKSLTRFISDHQTATRRLMIGGFYAIAIPPSYSGIDLLLSSISATNSNEAPLAYVGMILYLNTSSRDDLREAQIPIWIFRVEPMNPGAIESQRSTAIQRLSRYPPMLQDVVREAMPSSSDVGSGVRSYFEAALNSSVTPTDSIGALFRVVTGFYPREVINRLATFQPKYSTVLDRVRGITDLKIQVRIIVELLYDLALASQRKCSSISSTTIVTTM